MLRLRKFRGKGHCNATLCRAENTIYTAEQYILWESDGDLEQQAEARA